MERFWDTKVMEYILIVLWQYVAVSPFAILYINKLKNIAISTEMLKSATKFDNQNVSI